MLGGHSASCMGNVYVWEWGEKKREYKENTENTEESC